MDHTARGLPLQPHTAARRDGLLLGKIAGIAINLDWSLLIVFFLVAGTLALGLFPAWHPDWSAAHSWATAIAAAVLFFASVLAHELSHALVGRMHGVSTRRITLFVFGGMAEITEEPRRWRAELWMAIVGPLTSLVLGVGFLLLANTLAGDIPVDPENPTRALAQLSAVPTLLVWLGQINIVLAIFNLVPAFPLDGGRVLRAVMWGITGNLRKATRWAAGAGQAFAWLLIACGLAMALGARVPVFGTGPLGGLWLAFIGWFLNNAAVMSYRQLIMRDVLEDVPVSRLMQTDFVAVAPILSVVTLVDDYLLRSSQRTYPIVDDGDLLGIVTLEDVRRLDRSAWDRTTVREIMTPLEKLTTVKPQDRAFEVLSTLSRRDVNQLPVVEGTTLHGLFRREDVLKWLALYGDTEGHSGLRRAPA